MAVTDALTFMFMILCGVLSILFAIFKLPEFSVLFIIGLYYFSIFHIAQVVGESRGWYRDILPTYFIILAITIVSFAIIYYRYGLVQNGNHIDITIMESIYFSITTWTTLGYGDFSPISRIRHITSAEAILGYIGLGLWISLISNFIKNMAENRKEVREHNKKLVTVENIKSRTESFIGQASSDDLRIALHYNDAAKILYKSSAYQDGITLPFLFMIRQFLELALKYNIRKLNEISSCNNLMENLNREHDLNKIYQAFLAHYKSAKTIKSIKNTKEQKFLDSLKALIEKISILDFDSQGFRYSENTNGQKIIDKEETYNLKEVFDLLENTSSFLASVEDVFCLNLHS